MIDTHSHLLAEEFKDDLDLCVARCKENNVFKAILVGFNKELNKRAQELAITYKDFFYPTAGIHPEEVVDISDLFYLEDFIENNKIYAVGECGLDYHYRCDNKDLQKEMFEGQIKLSIKYNLPLIIHSRDAMADTYEILKKYEGKTYGVLHCFSGSKEMALKFIELGYYIGLDGPVTYKNAKEPKEVAKAIPLNRLLLETDCPYMTPVPHRGERNESAYVIFVAKEVANLRNISYKELEDITDNNAKCLFKI